ncbi:MAG TPA: hypothetical protein VNA22_06740 [Pyrinomonadaceae bacterium]|nr:hypothetical protein [Pyrinomonadaceae bacterium]
MQSPRFAAPLLFVLAIQILISCSSPAANQNANTTTGNASSSVSKVVPKDNAEEFAMLVTLPFEAEEVAWNENAESKSLIAVVRFSPEDTAKLSTELAKTRAGTPETLSVEAWYPAELIAQAELSGESSLKGKTYPAQTFLNPPYTKGKITQIDNTDYFVLQISA